MAPHGREMSQNLRKEIISLHKKGEGYKNISKALHISQNSAAKVIQKCKKDGSVTISQRCPGHPWKLTSRQERCYHHSMPLVIVHFSNLTMIQNTQPRPLLHF
uniref:Sleeping Beauty transposase HTH domain-containing protein n=1 Tax=Paramormyrops kingsleyae TaxID=1676925 RepID=A0A3B3RK66_9TELE